jgi:oligopeptide/dipeptide ABC transporter ATP-binding protein
MAEALLTTQGLSRRFSSGGGLLRPARSMTAVRDVTLTIPRGSVTGVVGESGCGKSTLARLVLRLIEPSEGKVSFDGTEITRLAAGELRRLRRRMQMVFQDPYSSLDPRYTIAEVLAEPFRVQGERVSREAVAHLLSQVGLAPEMAEAYPHQLSGGQRQRVGVARALAMKPAFVVLDEPTASLDVSIQAQIVALLERLRAELGLTYMFISHDLGLVRYFCDRILVMYLGSMVEELPSTEATPRHPYTRALLDSTFSPEPVQRRTLVALQGEIPSPFDLPKGCAFAGRCPRASALCRAERPALEGEPGGHRVACFHPL